MQHRKFNPNEIKVEFPSPKIAERERKENNKVEFLFIQFRFHIFFAFFQTWHEIL